MGVKLALFVCKKLGLAINLIHHTLNAYNNSNIWEITCYAMTKKNIGNIYKPPKDVNENYRTFIEEFANKLVYLHKFKSEVIIAGDYHID